MANYPVVIYGASGYTGMLVMDWLIDQNIPFKAVGRDTARSRQGMKSSRSSTMSMRWPRYSKARKSSAIR